MQLTCIVCPMGCRITPVIEDGKVISATGNRCKRGEEYAKTEFTNPVRTLTSTIAAGGLRVPVKSEKPLPKERLFEFIDEIRSCRAMLPVKTGDIIINNIGGTGINIIATGNAG